MILIIHTGVLFYFYKHGMPGRIVHVCHTLSWRFWGHHTNRSVKLKSLQQSQVYFFSFSHFVPMIVLVLLFILLTHRLIPGSYPGPQPLLLPRAQSGASTCQAPTSKIPLRYPRATVASTYQVQLGLCPESHSQSH